MKRKVAVLTAGVLCLILIVFDSFIYLTLYNHLSNMEKKSLITQSQSIAQYYNDNIKEKHDTNSTASPDNDYAWMRQFARYGQTILIVNAKDQVISKIGSGPTSEMLKEIKQIGHVSEDSTPFVQQMDQKHLLTISQIIDSDTNKTVGYVLLLSDNKSIRAYMDTLLTLLVVGSIGAVVLAAVAGYVVSSMAVRPINQMIQLVERIQINRLSERVNVPEGADEIARLASTFNHMLNRMERSFDQQSRFVADASHEIRTPLTIIQGYANLLRRWGMKDQAILEKAVRVIQKESTRLRKLTEDLLTLASLDIPNEDQEQHANVANVIEEIVDTVKQLNEDVNINTDVIPDTQLAMSPIHLRQILNNLIDNAIKYARREELSEMPNATPHIRTEEEPSVHISVESVHQQMRIHIRDNGRGVPSQDLPHIFDRFYRVDKSRARNQGGTGLGLSIVKELVDLYQGTIEISSEEGVGTTLTVTLPAIEL